VILSSELLIKLVIPDGYKLFITNKFSGRKPVFSGLTLLRESFRKAPVSLSDVNNPK
jgi:hypothetical protein